MEKMVETGVHTHFNWYLSYFCFYLRWICEYQKLLKCRRDVWVLSSTECTIIIRSLGDVEVINESHPWKSYNAVCFRNEH